MSILPDSGRGDVFALPDRMPGKLRHVRHSCTVFGGLAGAGEVGADTLQAMANLVPCGYPALTTGNARLQYLAAPTTGAAHGLTLHRGKVVLAQGTGLFVSSGAGACTRLGNVTDTDKRFASFGDLLFILPDGLVYNAADGSLRKFGLDTGNMENVSIDNVYLTVPTAGLQTKGFRVGDCIRLDIQGDIKSAVLNGYYRISALTESYLCVEGGCRYSRRLLHGKPFYGGMYVEDYKRDTTQFKRAVEMNLRESDGLMVFDIVHIIDRDWWGPLQRAVEAYETGEAGR